MKVHVIIHTSHGREFKKKKVGQDNKILLRKKPKWEMTLKDYETKNLLFGRVKYFTDVWEGAPESWIYDRKLKPEDQPELTQAEVAKYAKAKVFERRYQSGEKETGKWILYLILMVQIASVIINYLISSGRLRL